MSRNAALNSKSTKNKLNHEDQAGTKVAPSFFDNLPELISPKQIEDVGLAALATVYDWKYRPGTYNVPADLFLARRAERGRLKIRKSVLKEWFSSFNK